MSQAESTPVSQASVPPAITPAHLRALLQRPGELALLDVREVTAFAKRHLLYAVSVPSWQIELSIHRKVPRKSTPIVLTDADGSLVNEAQALLTRLGYSNVQVLGGGIDAWVAAGLEVFSGVNVPSKAFGEIVEIEAGTPHISAQTLHDRLQQGERLVVVDGRTPEEFFRFSIPGAFNIPNAELPYRLRELAPDPTTPIVVNCAGRTRSIIGAQTLIDAGVPNPVVSLKDGTMAWLLNGYDVAVGRRTPLPQPTPDHLDAARSQARALLARANVASLSEAELQELLDDPQRTTYLFDIRHLDEYRAGHLPGWRWAAGGQLIQATDDYVATQGATIVLADWDGVRAATVAAWLVQLGRHTVYVHAPSQPVAELATGEEVRHLLRDPASPDSEWISAAELVLLLEQDRAVVLDVDSPSAYARRHVRGAWFVVPQALAEKLPELNADGRHVVITSHDGVLADSVVRRLKRNGVAARALLGGNRDWFEADYPTDQGSDRDLSGDDYAWRHAYDFTETHERDAAFHAYLEWEVELAQQIRRPGAEAPFSVLAAAQR